ncbi:MAG: hypothetical protein U0Q16_07930 [Bryobacteraceae bacterium]
MNHAESAEVAVFGAEGSVDNLGFLNEFGGEAFEGSEVALSVALGRLVLLDVVDEDFEAAVDAAMVEVEAEAADFDGFSTAFVLSGVDAGVELMEDLVVAGEEGLLEDFGVAAVDAGFEGGGGDDDAGFDWRRLGDGTRLLGEERERNADECEGRAAGLKSRAG